jgi:two-component system heavy metal sensor histidine kinase CusS
MFSKFATFGLPTMMARRGWEYRSIANTLAILHTLAVFISFSCASVLLYNSLLDHLNQANFKQILEKTSAVKTMVLAPNGLKLLDVEIKSQMYELGGHKIFIKVSGRDGQTIKESFGINELFPAPALSPSHDIPKSQKIRTHSGQLYLLNSVPFTESKFIGDGYIQVAMDISEDETLAKKFMYMLIIFSLVGLLFAIISSLIIIRLVLEPLNEISYKIKNITEFNLDSRLDVALFPEEMKSMGGSFNIMIGRMESSFKKLSQYSENLAHELRTPLNNLILEAGVALSQQRTSEDYQKVISSSLEEYDRLSLLIDRLLFLVRADNKQFKLEIEKVDVLHEFENIVEFYSDALIEKGVTVTIAGAASCEADVVLFNRAVNNLFSNALKYTECGGSITLAVLQNNNNTIEISVEDTGSGIDPLLLPKIFDRYFWVESSRQKDRKGTGLGLDIVKAIMKLHGGSVEIQSELGKGTTVKLYLPQAA